MLFKFYEDLVPSYYTVIMIFECERYIRICLHTYVYILTVCMPMEGKLTPIYFLPCAMAITTVLLVIDIIF